MRTLHKYIAIDFLTTFLVTLSVVTFVMSLSALIRAMDLLARGVSGEFIARIFLYNMPFLLTFSIPISVLTSVLLLFGRLSCDGELTAMRACGLTMWQILSPLLLIGLGLSVLTAYLNSHLAPRGRLAFREMLFNLGMEQPINLLEEGRFVRDFPGLMVYVGRKSRQAVEDVVIYEVGDEGVKRCIRARQGQIRQGENPNVIIIDLYDVHMDQPKVEPGKAQYLDAQHYPVRLDLSEVAARRTLRKKTSDLTFPELIYAIRNVAKVYRELAPHDRARQQMALIVEASKRLALSVSCFAFVLLGAPLGMISRRRESSIGVGISLLLVFFFYFFIILANALIGRPEWRPDLIVWIPVVGSQAIGLWLIHRAN